MSDTTIMRPELRDLASKIYVDLVSDAVEFTDKSVTMTASAENLAKLSFKLAKVFEQAEDELNADNMPKNQGFKVDVGDIAKWTK